MESLTVGEGGESCQVRRVGILPFMKKCVGWATFNYSKLTGTQPRTALEKYHHDCPYIFLVLMADVFGFVFGSQVRKFVVVFCISLFEFSSPSFTRHLIVH